MDLDNYTELKEPAALQGSLNAIVSHAHAHHRPYALSESHAHEPTNILRASKSNINLVAIEDPQPAVTAALAPAVAAVTAALALAPPDSRIINVLLKFVFHTTLISMFETLFFFHYVSVLEDTGLQSTVGGFIQNAVNVCRNFTPAEQAIVTYVLQSYINVNQTITDGNQAYRTRSYVNQTLNTQSWIYVGGLGGVFVVLVVYACVRKIQIHWMTLFVENMVMVTLLGAYEYMFFTTIIKPYEPISGNEIAAAAISTFQTQCHLFVS